MPVAPSTDQTLAVDQRLIDDHEIVDEDSDSDSDTESVIEPLFDSPPGRSTWGADDSDTEVEFGVEDEQVGSRGNRHEGLLGAVNSELRRLRWPGGDVGADDLARALASLSAQRVILSKDSKGAGQQVAQTFVSGTIARMVGGSGEAPSSWWVSGNDGDTDSTVILDLGDRQLHGVQVGDFYRLGGSNLYVGVDAVRHGTPKGKQELAEQVRQFLGDGLTLYRGVPAWHPSWREIRNGAVLPLDG
ncbi:hypothetical protein ABZX92_45945, partial [Lentzea sp. NPDC006480]|uniref:hypothetical protein n=1 Tax=Lentzea sp. NPDC006480 TaxID=3157176 RepID=UPI0033B00C6E